MPSGYDAVVIGAGHNGLTCGCYLAKAGLKVLVREQYSEIGGMTISEEIAAPGFLSDVHASGYLVAKLTPAPQELGLAAHGLELITPDPNWAQVFPDGKALAIGRDLEMTVKSFAQFSAKDGETYQLHLIDTTTLLDTQQINPKLTDINGNPLPPVFLAVKPRPTT